jgi:outer membrane protein TolC
MQKSSAKTRTLHWGTVAVVIGGMLILMTGPWSLANAINGLPTGNNSGEPTIDSKIKELLNERLTLQRKIHGLMKESYRVGEKSSEEVHHAQLAIFETELELCETDKDRIVVLEKILTAAKEYEVQVANEKVLAGTATAIDKAKAKISRLNAEIALERAKARVAPPK